MREFGDLVARARRPRSELAGHGPVAGMKRKRLFRRQAPVRAETRFQIRGTEAPEGRVPGRTVALYFVRAAWDVPALDDFLQEAVAQGPLAVRARQVARPDRPRPFRGLEFRRTGSPGKLRSAREALCRGLGSRWFTERFHR